MTKDQYERIKNNTQVKGFSSMSGFMRFAALERDLLVEQKIIEIHNHLFGKDAALGAGRQPGVRARPKQHLA